MRAFKSHLMLGLGSLTAVVLLASSEAQAKPPQAKSASALVGRVRTRAGVVDLTVDTLADGGPAHGLVQGLAQVIADADVRRVQEAPPPEPTRSHP
jgi:hypothetical protein